VEAEVVAEQNLTALTQVLQVDLEVEEVFMAVKA